MESDKIINIIKKKRLNSKDKRKFKILIFKLINLFFYFIILIYLLLNKRINKINIEKPYNIIKNIFYYFSYK